MLEKLVEGEADVFGNLTEQDWGEVSTLMERNRCASACGIAEWFVRSALADFDEAEFDENGDDFIWLENGNIAHDLSDGDVLNPDELGLQNGFAILQQHRNNLVQVMVDFIQRFHLGMRAGKTRNETNEQARLWAPLNDR